MSDSNGPNRRSPGFVGRLLELVSWLPIWMIAVVTLLGIFGGLLWAFVFVIHWMWRHS